MITRVEAYRYRCFQSLQVDLEKYQVFVGANGAGKSTILDLLNLFAEFLDVKNVGDAFMKPTASHSIPRTSKLEEVIYNLRGDQLSLALEIAIPDELSRAAANKIHLTQTTKDAASMILDEDLWPGLLRYELFLTLFNDQLQISGEHLLILPRNYRFSDNPISRMVGELDHTKNPFVIPIIYRSAGQPAILAPEIKLKGKAKTALDLKLDASALALNNIPADATKYPLTIWLKDFLTNQICAYRPDLGALRQACRPQLKDAKLQPDASNIAWKIMALESADKDTWQEWCDHVRIALPQVKAIFAKPREDDKYAYFWIEYKNGLKVNAPGLSDGTLSILAYTLPAFLPAHMIAKQITVEEPENGIHPRGIEAILEALSMIKESHVWVTTHSPVVVANTPAKNLLCLQQTKDEGSVLIQGDKHPQLKEWKGTPGLETLFSAGVLG